MIFWCFRCEIVWSWFPTSRHTLNPVIRICPDCQAR